MIKKRFNVHFRPAAPTGPSENPAFSLFYFNLKALAEPIRFLFAYGGQEYEDVRVTRDEWPALKPSKHLINFKLFFFNLKYNLKQI